LDTDQIPVYGLNARDSKAAAADDSGDQLHLEETLHRIYEMRNFNRWIYSLIEPYLGPKVVEIGCGVGSFTELLAEKDREVLALDIEPSYLERVRANLGSNRRVAIAPYDLSRPLPPELPAGSADAVVCMNVVEHLENDLEAFRHLVDFLAPAGEPSFWFPPFNAYTGRSTNRTATTAATIENRLRPWPGPPGLKSNEPSTSIWPGSRAGGSREKYSNEKCYPPEDFSCIIS
jgi:SAM-dependent methyltransferase